MAKQSKKGSLIETMTNIMIGYWINFGMNLVILPVFGFNVTIKDNFMIGALFTIVSVLRGYGVRRLYNHFGWFQDKKPRYANYQQALGRGIRTGIASSDIKLGDVVFEKKTQPNPPPPPPPRIKNFFDKEYSHYSEKNGFETRLLKAERLSILDVCIDITSQDEFDKTIDMINEINPKYLEKSTNISYDPYYIINYLFYSHKQGRFLRTNVNNKSHDLRLNGESKTVIPFDILADAIGFNDE